MSKDLSKIRELSESELSRALYMIAISMGAGEEKARAAAANAHKFKEMIDSASDKELEGIVNAVGRGRASRVLDGIVKDDPNKK